MRFLNAKRAGAQALPVTFVALISVCALTGGCNLFQGLGSFQEKKATPTPTPIARATNSDAESRSRAGSVDVRSRLPEGAATATPEGAK